MLTKGVNTNDSKNTVLNKLPYIAACSSLYEENYKVIKTFKEIQTNNFFLLFCSGNSDWFHYAKFLWSIFKLFTYSTFILKENAKVLIVYIFLPYCYQLKISNS